jgi:hypothetical protein
VILAPSEKNRTATHRAATYVAAAYMGAAGTVLFILGEAMQLPDFVRGLSIGVMLGALALLFLRKLRDEYFDRLWNAGTSWAFATCVALFLAAPFVAEALGGSPLAAFQAYPGGWIGPLSILAFFAGFHWARLRS